MTLQLQIPDIIILIVQYRNQQTTKAYDGYMSQKASNAPLIEVIGRVQLNHGWHM